MTTMKERYEKAEAAAEPYFSGLDKLYYGVRSLLMYLFALFIAIALVVFWGLVYPANDYFGTINGVRAGPFCALGTGTPAFTKPSTCSFIGRCIDIGFILGILAVGIGFFLKSLMQSLQLNTTLFSLGKDRPNAVFRLIEWVAYAACLTFGFIWFLMVSNVLFRPATKAANVFVQIPDGDGIDSLASAVNVFFAISVVFNLVLWSVSIALSLFVLWISMDNDAYWFAHVLEHSPTAGRSQTAEGAKEHGAHTRAVFRRLGDA